MKDHLETLLINGMITHFSPIFLVKLCHYLETLTFEFCGLLFFFTEAL